MGRARKGGPGENRHPEPLPEGIQPDTEAEALWDSIVARLRESIPISAAEHWLDPVSFHGVHEDVLIVAAPPRALDWFRRRFAPALGEMIREDGRWRGLRACNAPELTRINRVY